MLACILYVWFSFLFCASSLDRLFFVWFCETESLRERDRKKSPPFCWWVLSSADIETQLFAVHSKYRPDVSRGSLWQFCLLCVWIILLFYSHTYFVSKEVLRQNMELLFQFLKKGDNMNLNNYRGISLGSTSYKLLSHTILVIITSYVENIIGGYQCEFRRNRTTFGHLILMLEKIEHWA